MRSHDAGNGSPCAHLYGQSNAAAHTLLLDIACGWSVGERPDNTDGRELVARYIGALGATRRMDGAATTSVRARDCTDLDDPLVCVHSAGDTRAIPARCANRRSRAQTSVGHGRRSRRPARLLFGAAANACLPNFDGSARRRRTCVASLARRGYTHAVRCTVSPRVGRSDLGSLRTSTNEAVSLHASGLPSSRAVRRSRPMRRIHRDTARDG